MDSIDRPPLSTDNPRHAVWIEDEQGIRRITAANPGEEEITIRYRVYRHTREINHGQWVYTSEAQP